MVDKLNAQKAEVEGKVATLQWQIYARAASDGRLPLAAGNQTQATDLAPAVAMLVKEVPTDALTALGLEPAKRNDKQKKLVNDHREKLQSLATELASTDERGQFDAWKTDLDRTKSQYPAPLPKGYIWYEEGPTAEPSKVLGRGDPRSPGAEVAPGFPAILVDKPPAAPRRRRIPRAGVCNWLAGWRSRIIR